MEYQDTEKRLPDAGGIALQVHGGGDYTKQFVRYRNIRVKEFIPEHAFAHGRTHKTTAPRGVRPCPPRSTIPTPKRFAASMRPCSSRPKTATGSTMPCGKPAATRRVPSSATAKRASITTSTPAQTPDGRPGAIVQFHVPRFWKDREAETRTGRAGPGHPERADLPDDGLLQRAAGGDASGSPWAARLPISATGISSRPNASAGASA